MRTRVAMALSAQALLGLAGVVSVGTAQQVSIGARWEVALFLNIAPEALSRVTCVKYTPPSPRAAQEVCRTDDPAYPFAYRGVLPGGTKVAVLVRFADGSTQQINYEVPAPERTWAVASTASTPGAASLSVDNVARKVNDDQWAWMAFITGPDALLAQVRCVEYTLHPTFPDPVREVCQRGTGAQAFPLSAVGWGTFQLKIRVRYRDGRTENLTHDLKFEAGAPVKE